MKFQLSKNTNLYNYLLTLFLMKSNTVCNYQFLIFSTALDAQQFKMFSDHPDQTASNKDVSKVNGNEYTNIGGFPVQVITFFANPI